LLSHRILPTAAYPEIAPTRFREAFRHGNGLGTMISVTFSGSFSKTATKFSEVGRVAGFS
jgi:hypothetical protein